VTEWPRQGDNVRIPIPLRRKSRQRAIHTCYAQVARKGELQPAAQRGSVHGRDGGHGQALELAERGAQVGEEPGDLALGHAAPFCQIGAGAERARGGRVQDEHADGAVEAYGVQAVGELLGGWFGASCG
jgi:hypothetical protein